MTAYETVTESTRPLGEGGYIEAARKRLRDEDGESEFLILTRGVFEKDGTKRWTRFITLPDDPALLAWVAQELTRLP